MTALVDVVVVAYNSRRHLRSCVFELAQDARFRVVVVDNASPDGSLAAVSDLPIETIPLDRNCGFAYACNAGSSTGNAPFVLLLNPDAVISPDALMRLVRVLLEEASVGVVGPRILHEDGSLDFSQRSFPRLCSTYSRALFLNQLFPRARWADELVRDCLAYVEPRSPDWLCGACLLVRRTVLEEIGGLDEGFFLYCEDKDLCRRTRDAGYDVRYEPEAICMHIGGASAPRSALLPLMLESRVRYADKHFRRPKAAAERLGLALTALTHILVTRGGYAQRVGHARSFGAALLGGSGRHVG